MRPARRYAAVRVRDMACAMDNNGTLTAALAFISAKGNPSVSADVCKERLRTQLVDLAPPSDGVDEYLRKIAAGTEALLATMVAASALGGGTLRGKLIGVVAWIVAAAVSTFISGRPGLVLTLYLPGGWLKFHGGHCASRRPCIFRAINAPRRRQLRLLPDAGAPCVRFSARPISRVGFEQAGPADAEGLPADARPLQARAPRPSSQRAVFTGVRLAGCLPPASRYASSRSAPSG